MPFYVLHLIFYHNSQKSASFFCKKACLFSNVLPQTCRGAKKFEKMLDFSMEVWYTNLTSLHGGYFYVRIAMAASPACGLLYAI
ncbi:hypothetical protein [uncultured Ruminococcus sp.]|jgi:hypothetical protein|uniref:hypothetical protein n=1 Tax=uncultured Ruminococcus sp. TaxID=165186 RepID=UPI000A85E677|nr:hypothetical protein [uncultured Ruminococcus sp.]MCB5775461.1 hypothetical protein [Ruminococcus callidus]